MSLRRLLISSVTVALSMLALSTTQLAAGAETVQGDGSSIDALAARLGTVEGSMGRYLRGLSPGQRSDLRTELGALSADQRSALRERVRAARRAGSAAAPPAAGRAASSASAAQRGPNPTLQYDTDTPHVFRVPVAVGSVPRGGGAGAWVGNLFDTGFGDPHTISQIQVQMNGVFTFSSTGTAGLLVARPPDSAGRAPVLVSTFQPALPGLVPWTFSGTTLQGLSGPFVVVVDQSPNPSPYTPYAPAAGAANVAVDVNAARGMANPFHGITFTDAYIDRGPGYALYGANLAPTVPDVTPMGGPDTGAPLPFNAIIRVIGPSLPVELMSFGVDE